MKPLKKSVTITLDLPVLDQTRLLAEEEDRSLSSYINLVLKAHLEQKTGDNEGERRFRPKPGGIFCLVIRG